MTFKKYTQCYAHTPGDKPFNESDLAGLAIVHGLLPGAFFGALTGLALGFLAGGPIGAVIGIFSGITVGLALALNEAANEWRFHRLACVSGVKCAVGTVREQPTRGDLGQFDNDQFFDLQLMPHPIGHDVDGQKHFAYDYAKPSDNYKIPKPGFVYGKAAQDALDKHLRNDVYIDGAQGSELVMPTIADLPYDTTRNVLHCEAEGDFWVRMADLGLALGALIALLVLVTAGAAYAGGAAGAAIGCAIGGFFGPIGCLIGAILGAILGALLAGGAAAGISYLIIQAILEAIFDADPGDVEDANVGDHALGPISAGDRVVVLGEHVYDGFHEGWHEIHPLMAVIKIADRKLNAETNYYLEWDPNFPDSAKLPEDLPEMPATPPDQDITKLSRDDMRRGLESDKFRRRVEWLRARWCALLREAFDEGVRRTQQGLTHRWTIHPQVDGCQPGDGPPIIK